MVERQPAFSPRPAVAEDFPAVLAIERSSYPLPWTEGHFREEMEKPFSRFLVLTDDETDAVVAGYIVYWILFDECHVLNVAVHPGWRGLALGTRLVREAIRECVLKGARRVYLEARKSNAAAVAFYQKLGFYVDHVKKGFYADGEDAYFMQRYLDRREEF